MDPLRLIVRTLFGYVFLLVLIRLTGKRTVKHGGVANFVVALVVGDMFDDLVWAEVPAAQFVVAVGTLVFLHLLASINLYISGARTWRRSAPAGWREPAQ
jgi:uncharacterized membrane protein YcaP (DUF421 family)